MGNKISSSLSVNYELTLANLNNLPLEIYYCYLFEYLSLDDVLKLRAISKRFYAMVRNYISELHFKDGNINGNWFSTTKLIKFRIKIDNSKLPLLINSSINLPNLKYLKVDKEMYLLSLELLNKFNRLRILDICLMYSYSDCALRLPELRALNLRFKTLVQRRRGNRFGRLGIDAPELQSLSISQLNRLLNLEDPVVLKNPLSIKYLQLGTFRAMKIQVFENLEVLEIDAFQKSDLELFIDEIPRIRKFKIRNFSPEVVSELKDLFRSKNDLEFVLYGVKIDEISKFDEFVFGDIILSETMLEGPEENAEALKLEFQLSNYGKLEDDQCFITHLNFNALIRRMPNQPSNLFKKYTNIQTITISKFEDPKINSSIENQFISFIGKCPSLNVINIHTSLSQEFYDRLPAVTLLTILCINVGFKLDLNFRFVFKMLRLERLFIDQHVEISKEFNLFSLSCLREVSFTCQNFRSMRLTILKCDKDRYILRSFNKTYFNSLEGSITFDQVIKFCNDFNKIKKTRVSS